jgi:glucosylceramidase
MHNAFTRSSTSGYTHWWCAQNTTGDNALIRLSNDSYTISARLWAFAGYFRFARPGSVRVDASSDAEDVYVSAFVNVNGTVAVPVVNAAHFARKVRVQLSGVGGVRRGGAWLTDNGHNVSEVGRVEVRGGGFEAMVEARSLKTFFLEG